VTLGAPSSHSPEDDDVALPFAPEVGGAVAFDGGFGACVLTPSKKETAAVLVVLGQGLPAAKRIDLGSVHGDVLGPRVVGSAKRFVVAVPDGAPNGTLVRFATVDDAFGAAKLKWGADVTEGRDDSDAFSLELGDKVAVFAWDEWDTKAEHSAIRAVTFSPSDPSKLSAPLVLSGAKEDAEAPAVVARAGGFWAAWIANTKRATDQKDRGASNDTSEPVDLGPRYVSVEPLDADGKSIGAPIAVTPKDGHVLGFDLSTSKDGSVLVAYRDDTTSPATAGGIVHLSLVRAGGSVEARTVTDENVGAGTPSLLADAAPLTETHGWLALTDEADAVRLVALDGEGRAEDALAVEPALGISEPLALRAGRVLVSRSHGARLDLAVFACEKGDRAMAGAVTEPSQ
jgi:hypothetical protein